LIIRCLGPATFQKPIPDLCLEQTYPMATPRALFLAQPQIGITHYAMTTIESVANQSIDPAPPQNLVTHSHRNDRVHGKQDFCDSIERHDGSTLNDGPAADYALILPSK
jgi:hypothetical protein